jgi:acyl carrier protein phosphodiesterase
MMTVFPIAIVANMGNATTSFPVNIQDTIKPHNRVDVLSFQNWLI